MSFVISSDRAGRGQSSGRRLYKVSFELDEDTKRRAPGNTERLWTEKPDAKMEVFVGNTPFYIKGIASGYRILVRADNDTRELAFDQLVEKSGNSTVRAIVRDPAGKRALEAVLVDSDCSWEIGSSGLLWAGSGCIKMGQDGLMPIQSVRNTDD